MKKFLSLVLALIMAMSLVTISAGATEYKDLTDKDEIQYEEAVAVLNRLGIITGYSDGSFRPEGELTRGAAAKIITSLMIGPEAAENLTVSSAPYTDVPVDNNFAAVINYCKSAGYISGYGDGTFRPSGKLTGYAFGKMLLGALGYKSEYEGFAGAGWNMKVAAIGNEAGLFDRVSFKGNEHITREVACQLALNTLKGTLVDYTGGMNVSNGDQTIVVNPTRSYKTSNQEFAQHIDNKKAGSQQASDETWYTVEFGEEHFIDLRMQRERSVKDDFGRPSNEWSYKKVTIGTYPVEPDYVYTTRVAQKDDPKVSDATKTRALGLVGFETFNDKKSEFTTVTINGLESNPFSTTVNDVAKIADYTDNGTLVEVYVDDDDADFITDVVVIKTQLMEVKKVGSDYVSLNLYDDGSDAEGTDDGKYPGYNQKPIDEDVEDIEEENKNYTFLSGLKAKDIVAVVPVTTDGGKSYEVANAYTPETVTGSLDGSKTFTVSNDRYVVDVTVGGTTYPVALWNKDLIDADRDIIKVTKKDVTLYLDEFGCALLATDIGSTNDYMILGRYRNTTQNGVIVCLAEGWDIKGNAISLNIGAESSTIVNSTKNLYRPGDLVRYTNENVTSSADWVLSDLGVLTVNGNLRVDAENVIKKSNSTVSLVVDKDGNTDTFYKKDSVKTIYVAFEDNGGEVDYIEVLNGLQDTTKAEIEATSPNNGKIAQACVKLDNGSVTEKSEIEAIVIKRESNEANLTNLGFVYDVNTTNKRDENGDLLTDYRVFTKDDDDADMTSADDIRNRRFVRFAEQEDGNYDLRYFDRTHKALSVVQATIGEFAAPKNKNLVRLTDYLNMAGNKLTENYNVSDNNANANLRLPNISNVQNFGVVSGSDSTDLSSGDKVASNLVNLRGAEWLDLTSNDKIDDVDALKEAVDAGRKVKVALAFNDDYTSGDFRTVYMVIVLDASGKKDTDTTSTGSVRFDKDLKSGDSGVGTLAAGATVTTLKSGVTTASFTINKPSWAASTKDSTTMFTVPAGKVLSLTYDVLVDGDVWYHSAAIFDSSMIVSSDGTSYGFKDLSITGTNLDPRDVQNSDGTTKEVTVVITSVDWRYAVVKYTLNGESIDNMMDDSKTYRALQTFNYSNPKLHFAIGDLEKDDFSATFTVSGMAERLDASRYTNVQWEGSNSKQQHTDEIFAKGFEPVVVNIKTDDKLTSVYSVKGEGDLDSGKSGIALAGHFGVPSKAISTTAESAMVKIVSVTDVKAGQTAGVRIQLDKAATDKGVYKYIATLKVDPDDKNTWITHELKNGTDGELFMIDDVNSNIVITEDMISIERVARVHVKDAYVMPENTAKLVLVFSTDIELADGASLTGNNKVQMEIKDNTIIFTVAEGAWGADVSEDSIGVGQAKVQAVGDSNNTNYTTVVKVAPSTLKTSITTTWPTT